MAICQFCIAKAYSQAISLEKFCDYPVQMILQEIV